MARQLRARDVGHLTRPRQGSERCLPDLGGGEAVGEAQSGRPGNDIGLPEQEQLGPVARGDGELPVPCLGECGCPSGIRVLASGCSRPSLEYGSRVLDAAGDLTGDGAVNLDDLTLMLAQFGARCP